jgi:hypothetical protein
MILVAQPPLYINVDMRRLDKFGVRDSESDYTSIVGHKSAEDFTDTHLDIVKVSNWWRLAKIWSLVLGENTPADLLTESNLFIKEVQDFYDVIRGTNEDSTRSSILMNDGSEFDIGNENCLCDSV